MKLPDVCYMLGPRVDAGTKYRVRSTPYLRVSSIQDPVTIIQRLARHGESSTSSINPPLPNVAIVSRPQPIELELQLPCLPAFAARSGDRLANGRRSLRGVSTLRSPGRPGR